MSAAGDRAVIHAAALESVSCGGFTLIEALVTIAIAALIAGIGFPAIERQTNAVALNGAAGAVALALRETRAEAMRLDSRSRLMLASDRRSLLRDGTIVYTAPAGIALTLPPAGFSFYADGTGGAGGVVITGQAGRRTVAVDPLPGGARP